MPTKHTAQMSTQEIASIVGMEVVYIENLLQNPPKM